MLLTAREVEILFDAISDFAAKYSGGAGADKIKYAAGRREVHIAPLTPLPANRLDELDL